MNKIKFAFFGTPHFAATFLDDLEKNGLVPSLVITTPDRPQGRGMTMGSPPVKMWADERCIPVLQPETFDKAAVEAIKAHGDFDVFVVIYYGKIIPRSVFDHPTHGTLNVHFSMLPRWRGTSPVRAAIAADDKEIGITIHLLHEKVDYGPIVAAKKLTLSEWPPKAYDAEKQATHESALLLAKILPTYVAGDIEPREQNHDVATTCPKYEKEDGLLDLNGDPYKNLLKIRAFDSTVGTHAYFERGDKKIRVQIMDAHMQNGKLVIDTVKPEGKSEMRYEEFLRSGAKPL